MPRHEVRTWLNFRQTVVDRIGTKAALIVLTNAGTELWRLEQGRTLDPDLQHRLWESPGQFFVTGHLEVDARWQAERWPMTEAAQSIEKALGLPVYASYSRGEGPNPFPAPPELVLEPEPPPMEFG